jgi:Right handed beta helix region
MRIAIAVLAAAMALTLVTAGAPAKSHRVLRVGTFHGVAGNYKTIQSAVNAANPGDWILVAPGDYKEAVRIKKDDIHLRGLNRNSVIVDGTNSGKACSSKKGDQNFKRGDDGNGIEVFKADGVYIENLTACNFLGEGNQIWWNGGDGSGKIGMKSWYGSYLPATTTYFNAKKPQATYGIFISNAKGPGSVSESYASNMNDAAYYVGACHPCNATLDHVQGEHNTLGYSGTNSSKVTIQRSEFNDNFTGIATNSQNNDDAPSPQLGSTFSDNFVHDNNNPNVPSTPEGLRAIGVGIVVAGGRNNKIESNRVLNNGAWGIVLGPFPDDGKPPKVAHCQGGSMIGNPFGRGTLCFYDVFNNEVSGNKLGGNGSFGNPTNGDLAEVSNQAPQGNCWHDNSGIAGKDVTSQPADLQSTHAQCGVPNQGDGILSPLADQLICDTGLLRPCPEDATHKYPRTKKVTVKPLPRRKTMPDPCKGVPANPWCKS